MVKTSDAAQTRRPTTSSDSHAKKYPEQRDKGAFDDELPADHPLLKAQSPQNPDLASPLVDGAGADDGQPRHPNQQPEGQKSLHDLHERVSELLPPPQDIVQQEALRARRRELLLELPTDRNRIGPLVHAQKVRLLRLEVRELFFCPLTDHNAVDHAEGEPARVFDPTHDLFLDLLAGDGIAQAKRVPHPELRTSQEPAFPTVRKGEDREVRIAPQGFPRLPVCGVLWRTLLEFVGRAGEETIRHVGHILRDVRPGRRPAYRRTERGRVVRRFVLGQLETADYEPVAAGDRRSQNVVLLHLRVEVANRRDGPGLDGAVVAGELLVAGMRGGGRLGAGEDRAYGDHVQNERKHRERKAGAGGARGRVGNRHFQNGREPPPEAHREAQNAVYEAEVERCEQHRSEDHQDALDEEYRRALLVGPRYRLEVTGKVRVRQNPRPGGRPDDPGRQGLGEDEAEPERCNHGPEEHEVTAGLRYRLRQVAIFHQEARGGKGEARDE